jgi:hypothetical protein
VQAAGGKRDDTPKIFVNWIELAGSQTKASRRCSIKIFKNLDMKLERESRQRNYFTLLGSGYDVSGVCESQF